MVLLSKFFGRSLDARRLRISIGKSDVLSFYFYLLATKILFKATVVMFVVSSESSQSVESKSRSTWSTQICRVFPSPASQTRNSKVKGGGAGAAPGAARGVSKRRASAHAMLALLLIDPEIKRRPDYQSIKAWAIHYQSWDLAPMATG